MKASSKQSCRSISDRGPIWLDVPICVPTVLSKCDGGSNEFSPYRILTWLQCECSWTSVEWLMGLAWSCRKTSRSGSAWRRRVDRSWRGFRVGSPWGEMPSGQLFARHDGVRGEWLVFTTLYGMKILTRWERWERKREGEGSMYLRKRKQRTPIKKEMWLVVWSYVCEIMWRLYRGIGDSSTRDKATTRRV